ncbi:MAG: yqhT [Oscillospiraceae bacterium]|jgi:Xaa-Pro aminopeptidase|nr:yqhT [Oscillospiraceae bacterium]
MDMNNIEKLTACLPPNIDAVLVTSSVNRHYFTGFESSAGTVLITREQSYLIIDFRYFEKAKREVTSCKVVLLESFQKQVSELFKKHRIQTVGIESFQITVNEFQELKQKFPDICFEQSNEVNCLVNRMRQIKTPTEVERMRQAQNITDQAFEHILNFIQIGKTEKQVATELEYHMKKLGADGFAFDTISVSGKNSSLPHGTPTDKALQKGDFLTLDFGAKVDGYCSDMTRTVCLGSPDELQKKVYQTVLKAQSLAFEKIVPGEICRVIDEAARSYIYQQGFEGCFGHGLGHAVGLEIHETPCFNIRDESRLEPGMVITVEPGIYIEDHFGVRIEDMVIVTEKGYQNMTKSVKELISL